MLKFFTMRLWYSKISPSFLIVLCFLGGSLANAQQNLSLSTSIQLALDRNTAVEIEKWYNQLAIIEVEKSKIRPNPTFNAQILMLTNPRFYPDNNLYISPYNRQDWFQLTKRMQVLGQRKNKIALQNQNLQTRHLEFADYKRKLAYDVSISWLELWFAQINKDIANEAVLLLQNLTKAKKLKPEDLEFLRFKILDDQYDMLYAYASLNYNQEIETLKLLTATVDTLTINMNDTFFDTPISQNLDSLYQLAYVHRADYLKTISDTKSQQINLALQRSNSFPTPEFGVIANPQNTIPYFGFFLTQPIPLFDRNQAEKQKAKTNISISKATNSYTVLQIQSEIKTSLISYQNYEFNKTRVKRMLEDSQLLMTSVRKLFVEGKKTEVDLWESEQAWFDAEKLFYNNEYEYRKSKLELLHALGLLH